MDESQTPTEVKNISFIGRHRFMLFITLSVSVAITIVGVSMYIYSSSGAAQLDLSRPGYVSVRDQVTNSTSEFPNYPNNGPISQSDIDNFKSLYSQQAQKIKLVDAFSGDPLNLDSLVFSNPATTGQ